MKKKVIVIGGGIAGMEASARLCDMGFDVSLLEKNNTLGGNVANWHHLFPDGEPAANVIQSLKLGVVKNTNILFDADIHTVVNSKDGFQVNLTDGQTLQSQAILLTTGYDLFDANKKEEYGYGIYDNVITSAQLEETLKNNKALKTAQGNVPKRVAMIHCVGSRDQKVGNAYCSKVCCVTGVKQAMEIKKQNPQTEVFCFYMDLRMFDRQFEDLYLQAQTQYGIHFVRGRLSESCENQDGSIVLKAEDTLASRPIKMNVDLMVLMVGMTASKGTQSIAQKMSVAVGADKFIATADSHLKLNETNISGVFVSGTCTGPKSVAETIADARSAAIKVAAYLNNN